MSGGPVRTYKELLESKPTETEIRSYLIECEQAPITMRIPETLSEAALRGMSFSTFVRARMIEVLAKKGA